MKRLKEGDIFVIPLSNSKHAYGQFLIRSNMGPIIQVFDLITDEEIDVDIIIHSDLLFPPVITGLYAAIKTQYWTVVGNRKTTVFQHPRFVTTNWNEKKGTAGTWSLWNGEKFIPLGNILNEKYKKLEFLTIYPPQMITERIETGIIPFPYGELIKDNFFEPRNK